MAKAAKVSNQTADSRFEKMRKLAEAINKSPWGGDEHNIASVLGDDAVVSNVKRFTTGNLAIDYAFGGGVPRGKIIELWGGESAGKSTLVYHIIASYQKEYPDEGILLLDTEHSYDPAYAEKLGVNAKGIIYVEAESGLGALNIAKMACESGGANLVIIDSIAALTTKSDEEGDIGQQTMAEQARMVSQAFRVLNSLSAQHDITIIVTNQVRDNIGVMYGDKSSTPAGKALKHYAHIRAKMTRTKQVKNKKEEIVAVEGRLDCIKNKVASPFRKANYTISFGIGIDRVIGDVDLAVEKGVIKKKGSWFVYNEEQFQGTEGFTQTLRDNPEMLEKLESEIRAKMNMNESAAEDATPTEEQEEKEQEENEVEVEIV